MKLKNKKADDMLITPYLVLKKINRNDTLV
jgi:hypothetical protein